MCYANSMKHLFYIGALLVVLSTAADAARTRFSAQEAGSISTLEIEQIKTNPESLLYKFLDAGPAMAQYISRIIQTDLALMDSIMSIESKATIYQSSAIGAGFARAARAVGKDKPKTVSFITKKVTQSKNVPLKTTYFAIGPNLKSVLPPMIPAIIPPPQLTYQRVGQELPFDEARIGPPEGYRFKMVDGVEDQNTVIKNAETLERDAPSTAIIASQEEDRGGQGGQIIVTPPEPPKPPKPPVNPPDKPIDDVTKPPSGSGGSGGGSGGSSGSTSPI